PARATGGLAAGGGFFGPAFASPGRAARAPARRTQAPRVRIFPVFFNDFSSSLLLFVERGRRDLLALSVDTLRRHGPRLAVRRDDDLAIDGDLAGLLGDERHRVGVGPLRVGARVGRRVARDRVVLAVVLAGPFVVALP